MTFFYLEFISE